MKNKQIIKAKDTKMTEVSAKKPSKKLLKYLNAQIKAASPLKMEAEPLEELISSFQPRDNIEAMLLAQMAATHNLAMVHILGTGLEVRNHYSSPNLQKSIVANTKLLNLFTRQMEALQQYRGKASTQKIVVEQVKIEQGGQAVVGNITQGE